MLFVNLVAAGLLACSIFFTIKIVKSHLADRDLRRGWQISAMVLVIVGGLLIYQIVLGSGAGIQWVQQLSLFTLCLVLLVNAWLLKKTIEYIKEVNTINGINVYDPVSGVFNRAYLEQRLDTEVARCHRYGSPLGVVSAEINDFIQLNDEYGHQGSAIASTKIAKRLKDLLRETDVVASYSVGRFVLVLPDTPEGSLHGLVNRLRSAIDGLVVIDGAGVEESVKINVTFGTSHCELKTRSGKELIHKAFSSAGHESPYDYLTEPVDDQVANEDLYKQAL